MIRFPAKRVTFAVTGHLDNHASGKNSAAFLGFHTFFRSSDSNAADVCFVVRLRTALRAITCDKHCINSNNTDDGDEISASVHIIGLYPVQMNLGLRFTRYYYDPTIPDDFFRQQLRTRRTTFQMLLNVIAP